jgi:hypothetical protein
MSIYVWNKKASGIYSREREEEKEKSEMNKINSKEKVCPLFFSIFSLYIYTSLSLSLNRFS